MILFFVDYYSHHKVNGIVRYREILQSYIKSNTTIRIITIFVNAHTDKICFLKSNEILLPFDLGLGEYYEESNKLLSLFIENILKKEKYNNIIFHFNWMNHMPWVAYQRKQMPFAKFILTMHCVPWRDMITTNYIVYKKLQEVQNKKERISFSLKRFIAEELFYYSFADKIITVTEDAKCLLIEQYGFEKEKVQRIYNGINVIQHTKSISLNQYGYSSVNKVILYVGTLTERKGVHILIYILSRLCQSKKNVRLLICGSGDYEWIMSKIPTSLWGKVQFVGQKSLNDISDVSKVVDLAILPSLIEQCSFSALELIGLGIPTIVSNVNGLNEFIPQEWHNFNITYDCKDNGIHVRGSRIISNIKKLLYNKKISTAYSLATYHRISTLFTEENMCKNTIEIYENIFNNYVINNSGDLVSIIMPCYNAEDFILDTIKSVLSQTYANIELIIVDNASSDSTIEIISKIKDNRIKLIKNHSNKGISYSLNLGIKHAKGKYIARIDADDLMIETRIEKQLRFLQNNDEYVMVGTNIYISKINDNPCSMKIYPETSEEIRFYCFLFNPFAHPTIMIRANILKEYHYSSKYKHCEDYELWMNLCHKYKCYNLQEPLNIYRVHKKNVSLIYSDTQRKETLRLVFDELKKINICLTNKEELILTALHCNAPKQYWIKNKKQVMEFLNKINKFLNYPITNKELNDYVFSLVSDENY